MWVWSATPCRKSARASVAVHFGAQSSSLRAPSLDGHAFVVRARAGRDGCRVPIPWSGDAPPFGFGPGTGQPWLPQPADWRALTVERQQDDPASMLALYRAALALRRDRAELGDGTMAWIDTDGSGASDGVLAFRRDPGFVCVVNVGGDPAAPPDAVRDGALLLSSDPLLPDGSLPGTTSAWYAG